MKFAKLLTTALVAASSLFVTAIHHAEAAPVADWIYFDLGEVIVTGNSTAGYTYVPGAIDYLRDMRQRGYKVALVSNIPESWGAACSAKFDGLKDFLGTRLHETVPMDWLQFDKILLPPFDRYRKPQRYLFMRALENACPGRALYVGENPGEIAAARNIGFATYHSSESPDSSGPLPDPATVVRLLDNEFSFAEPAGCEFNSIISSLLLPQDVQNGIDGCAIVPE